MGGGWPAVSISRMNEDLRREQVATGWIEVWKQRGHDGVFVTWLPYKGQPGYPGHTYPPGDSTRPATNDPDELLSWARGRWGKGRGGETHRR